MTSASAGYNDEVYPESIPSSPARRKDAWMEDMIPDLAPQVFRTGKPACSGLGHELFYVGPDTKRVLKAIEICRRCPVRVECLQWAIDNHEEYGVRGGLTHVDREEYAQYSDASEMIRRVDLDRFGVE